VLCDVPAGAVESRRLAANDALISSGVGASYALCALGHDADNAIVGAISHAVPPRGTALERAEDAWLTMASLDAQMNCAGVDRYEIYMVGGAQLHRSVTSAPAPANWAGSVEWSGELMHEASLLPPPSRTPRHVRFAAAALGLSQGDAPGATRPASVCVFVTQGGVFYVPEN
jgi:hypothetical protein